MCSITGVGERLHKVLGHIGCKLWFPRQPKALTMEECCDGPNTVIFDQIFFKLSGNEDSIKSRTSSILGQIGLFDFNNFFPKTYNGENVVN